MRPITSRTRHACALFFAACALSACGGSGGGGTGFAGLPVAVSPPGTTTPLPPADTGVKPEKHCAP
ncbi:hypothetical protein [uncultured Variovorax sp.]|uniref:hypothetical protein n=1 Tax=uncultured Variovorax sp. TaxID=114708 RepID=UPI0025D48FA0|nr:hypothetical protein [uncultured Variovorax sp.]